MTGALIFAFNNEQIDYLALARWSAANIFRHLGIPTAIVTDTAFEPREYERVCLVQPSPTSGRYFVDYDATLTWYNADRTNAYTLSPWDTTLLLDADYVVATDQLKTLLDTPSDFLAHKDAYDATGVTDFELLNSFGDYRMPMYWATVVVFKKSKYAEQVFEMMSMIKNNWDHYRSIYKFANATYRNDYALSIALNTLSGHTLSIPVIPWSLTSLTMDATVRRVEPDVYRVEYQREQRLKYITLTTDFHAMCKRSLGGLIADPS